MDRFGNPFRANLAGWDNESRSSFRGEEPVTLNYAAIGEGGIVLTSDSQVTHIHRGENGGVLGTYEGQRIKIVRLGTEAAFSVSGNSGLVDTLLAKVEIETGGYGDTLTFEETVQKYRRIFAQEWNDKCDQPHPGPEAAFLFCGYIGTTEKKFPQIVRLDSRTSFAYNPITRRGWAWAGAESHGAALYLHHRFYRDAMPLEQLKLLAYSIVAEVADQDNSVGPPIEMVVVTPTGLLAIEDPEKAKYENARQRMIQGIGTFLADFR